MEHFNEYDHIVVALFPKMAVLWDLLFLSLNCSVFAKVQLNNNLYLTKIVLLPLKF